WGESVGAISPFFCSSKSLVSPNGRPPRARLSTSKVNFDGALPLGWKCPAKEAAAPCARAGLSSSTKWPPITNDVPTAESACTNSRLVGIVLSYTSGLLVQRSPVPHGRASLAVVSAKTLGLEIPSTVG